MDIKFILEISLLIFIVVIIIAAVILNKPVRDKNLGFNNKRTEHDNIMTELTNLIDWRR